MEKEMTQDCLKMKTHPQFRLKKTAVIPTNEDGLEERVEEFDNELTSKQVSKTYVKSVKKKRPVLKGTAKENLIDDMELSLIKELNDSRKKIKNRG